MINQLFSKSPEQTVIIKCLNIMGWETLNDTRVFIRSELETRNVQATYKLVLPELKEYYLPCKQKKYLSIQSIKSVITILRQLLKTIGYTIIGTECVINNKKNMIYKLGSNTKEISAKLNNIKIKSACARHSPLFLADKSALSTVCTGLITQCHCTDKGGFSPTVLNLVERSESSLNVTQIAHPFCSASGSRTGSLFACDSKRKREVGLEFNVTGTGFIVAWN